ncbi:MAG: hypothetical protein N2C14_15420 [Planctomycetales bacterium]
MLVPVPDVPDTSKIKSARASLEQEKAKARTAETLKMVSNVLGTRKLLVDSFIAERNQIEAARADNPAQEKCTGPRDIFQESGKIGKEILSNSIYSGR